MTKKSFNPRRGSGFFLGGPQDLLQQQQATEGSGETLPDLDKPDKPARAPTPVPGTSGATGTKTTVPTTGKQLSR